MKLYRLTCPTCGYTTASKTTGLAENGLRMHSCQRVQARAERKHRRLEREAAKDRTPTPCRCKNARHEHGTYVAYTIDKCRCRPCADAASAYERARNRRIAYGRDAYVDATPATRHVRALMAAGLAWERVADRAGVPHGSVYPLLYGKPERNGGRPRTRARQATVDALLAVPMPTLDDFPDGRLVPAAGSRRRLKALASIGWSVAALAGHLGIDRQRLDHALRHDNVTAATARAVRDAFRQLWNTPNVGSLSARPVNRAARLGWPMPLDLDDETVDDPAAPEPARAEPAKQGMDLDEWARLVRYGEDPTRAAARCGVRLSTVDQTIRRHGRTELLPLLRRAS